MTNTSSTDELVGRAQLDAAVQVIVQAVAQLSPDDIPLPDCPPMYLSFDQIERAGSAGKLLLARRVAESNIAATTGKRSAAEWMADKSGAPSTKAAHDLATSQRLGDLDHTARALKNGQLSGAQAGVIAGAAAANPSAEKDLVGRARSDSFKGLSDEAARRKAQADPDPEARQQRHHRERKAGFWLDAENALNFSARGPAVGGLRMGRLERRAEQLWNKARKAGGVCERRDAYLYDAFLELFDNADADTPAAGSTDSTDSTGAAGPGGPAGEPTLFEVPDPTPPAPRKGANQPKHLTLIHVDLAALAKGRVDDGEVCEIAGIGPVPVSAVRDLLGDSILKLVITHGVDVANVTHLGRGPTVAQKIALMWTDRCCTVAGCNNTRLQFDHRLDYQYTKHTRLDELDGLCKYHHDLKTRSGWSLAVGTGRRPMVPPGHPDHPGHPRDLTFEKYPEKEEDPHAPVPPQTVPGCDPATAAQPGAVPQDLLDRLAAVKRKIADGDRRAAARRAQAETDGGPTLEHFRRWHPREPDEHQP